MILCDGHYLSSIRLNIYLACSFYHDCFTKGWFSILDRDVFVLPEMGADFDLVMTGDD
jgi:hypothetical protein